MEDHIQKQLNKKKNPKTENKPSKCLAEDRNPSLQIIPKSQQACSGTMTKTLSRV